MEAPNKIYAMIVAGTLYADTKQQVVFNKPYSEYIRKDALLEWAKAVKADPTIPMNIDKVIEKIESL